MKDRKTLVSGLALVAALALGAVPAAATPILHFGQSDTTADPITAIANAAGTQTTISTTDAPITITSIDCAVPCSTPIDALFSLNATSTSAATTVGSDIVQRYSGSFSITSGGMNYLSGTFADALFGSGTGLTLTASDATPGESVTFTSEVITTLGSPRAISLAFADVTPPASIVGTTLASFNSSVAGDFSANTSVLETPEPATLALLGIALGGLGFARWRRSARAQS